MNRKAALFVAIAMASVIVMGIANAGGKVNLVHTHKGWVDSRDPAVYLKVSGKYPAMINYTLTNSTNYTWTGQACSLCEEFVYHADLEPGNYTQTFIAYDPNDYSNNDSVTIEYDISRYKVDFETNAGLTYVEITMTVQNLMSKPDQVNLTTFINSANFGLDEIWDEHLYKRYNYTYNVTVNDYGNVTYNKTCDDSILQIFDYDLDNNTAYCYNDDLTLNWSKEWDRISVSQKTVWWNVTEVIGNHTETRWKYAWKEKALYSNSKNNAEIKKKWENIHIGKYGSKDDTVVLKYTFKVPIVNRTYTKRTDEGIKLIYGKGSMGYMQLAFDNYSHLFYDYTHSSWWNSTWSYSRTINVTNNDATDTLEEGYTIPVEFNLTDCVNLGKCLENASDVRVVWYNTTGAVNVELDRIVEPSSALAFDGVDDYVQTFDPPPMSSWTVSAWFSVGVLDADTHYVVDAREELSKRLLFYLAANNEIKLGFYKGTILTRSHVPTVNDWHHGVVTYDATSSTMTTSFDGVVDTPITVTITDFNANAFWIGRNDPNTQLWNGTIDEVAIFNRALNSTEISELYNSGNPKPISSGWFNTTGLVGLWHFDIAGHDNSTLAYDSSGNGNNGTINGAHHAEGKIVPVAEGNNTIRFKLQENISAGSSDQNYSLYYGNPDAGDPPADVSDVFLDTGLVSYWSLDGHAIDIVGGNDGTIYGATKAAGFEGDALGFDGVNDYISLTTGIAEMGTDPEWTLLGWFNTTNGDAYGGGFRGNNVIFYVDNTGGSASEIFFIAVDTGVLCTNEYVSGWRYSCGATSVDDGSWHHFSTVYNYSGNGRMVTFLDGSEEINVTIKDFTDLDGEGTIGKYTNAGGDPDTVFNGTIDEVRIYNRSLSAEEISRLYIETAPSHSLGAETTEVVDASPVVVSMLPENNTSYNLKNSVWHTNISVTATDDKNLVNGTLKIWNATDNSAYSYAIDEFVDSIVNTTGTYEGGIENLSNLDGTYLIVHELGGTTVNGAFNFTFYFNDINGNPSQWKFHVCYDYITGEGSSGHITNWRYYNFTDSSWVSFEQLEPELGMHCDDSGFLSAPDVVNATGTAMLRLDHQTSGNQNHEVYVDHIALHSQTGEVATIDLINNTLASAGATLAEGTYLWNWLVYDNASQSDSFDSNYTITIIADTDPPDITFISPTLANGSSTTNNWVYVNVSISENPETVLIEWDGTNYTMNELNLTTWNYNATGLSEGTYTYTIFANDTAGNMNSTSRTVTTDWEPSTVTSISAWDIGISWAKVNWTNPTESDFRHTEVYYSASGTTCGSSGTFIENSTDNSITITALDYKTSYTVCTRTADTSYNINTTWVNTTFTTLDIVTPSAGTADLTEEIGSLREKIEGIDIQDISKIRIAIMSLSAAIALMFIRRKIHTIGLN